MLAAAGGTVSAAPIVPDFAAPTVVLSRYEANPGDVLDVTIAGFTSRVVTVTVCGNRGLRGSSDCDMTASESAKMNEDGSSRVAKLTISAPPTPCPCIVRVSSPTNDQVATAELVIVGHPIAEPVASESVASPLAASIDVERASAGSMAWLRSSLGGSTPYDVHISIRNTSTSPVDRVAVSGTANGGGGDVRARIEAANPGTIGPGETWERTVRVALPAPVLGNSTWRVDVSSAAPTVTALDDTSHLPGLLILLTVALAVDLLALAARFARRRWSSGRRDASSGPGSTGGDEPTGSPAPEVPLESREPTPVG